MPTITREWAEAQVRECGMRPTDRDYARVLQMALTGLWAWEIAERLGCTPEYVAKLKHK